MKRKARLIPLYLLLLSLLSACAQHSTNEGAFSPAVQQNFNATGYPIVDEPITLKAFQFELDSQSIDFQNLWFYQQLEEKTNIHIDFEAVKEADWGTRQNLMFASGDLPDLILRGSLDVEEYGVSKQLLVPLDDYLEEYMPSYYSRLQSGDFVNTLTASDGKTYSIGFLIAQDVNVNGHWFINQDWLDALGLDTPTTVDELTYALRAFKNGDPNGNGIADEVPYQATLNDTNTGLYNAFAFWGIPVNDQCYLYIDDTETVRLCAYADGFREACEWLHMLYAEGLLDLECVSQNSSLWSAKINKDSAGLMTYWRLQNSAIKPEIAAQFRVMLPVAAQGYEPAVSSTLEFTEFGAALTVANEHILETLRWLDAQFETETMMVSQNGPLGDTLTINDAGKYEVVYVPQDNELYTIVPVICGQFLAPAAYYQSVYEKAPHRVEKSEYCAQYTQAGVMEYRSYQYLTEIIKMTAEENGRANRLYLSIKEHMTESIAGFITMGVTDSSWQAFLDKLDLFGADSYITLYQQAYDRYLASAGRVWP